MLPEVRATRASTAKRSSHRHVRATNEVLGEWAALVQRPCLECRDELTLVDQPVLQREQAEEEVMGCR